MYNTQSKALDAVLLEACKKILCCSSKTCSEAVWGDLGIDSGFDKGEAGGLEPPLILERGGIAPLNL